MIRCTACGEIFEEPLVNTSQGYLNGFFCTLREVVCPYCNSAAIEEVEECEYCDGYKGKGTDMCDACHENLMAEVAEFLSQYDATELAAINQQLDGVHIGDFIGRYTKKE